MGHSKKRIAALVFWFVQAENQKKTLLLNWRLGCASKFEWDGRSVACVQVLMRWRMLAFSMGGLLHFIGSICLRSRKNMTISFQLSSFLSWNQDCGHVAVAAHPQI
ncbi:hypothetical protein RA21_14930 [Leisingera sp. ANG-DT]|nr:hypothetical protein RA21_14930 [Leisingera sp. ANG-DT]